MLYKVTYLGRNFSSTENDIDIRLMKALTAIDRLSIIWKSDLTDKMKHSFFQGAVVAKELEFANILKGLTIKQDALALITRNEY